MLDFSERLAMAMERAGLNDTQLAAKIGGQQQVVGRWRKKGGPKPEGRFMEKLPAVLDVSGHWLLTGQGPIEPPSGKELANYERGRAQGWREAVAATGKALLDAVNPTSAAEEREGLERLFARMAELRKQAEPKPRQKPA